LAHAWSAQHERPVERFLCERETERQVAEVIDVCTSVFLLQRKALLKTKVPAKLPYCVVNAGHSACGRRGLGEDANQTRTVTCMVNSLWAL